MDCKIKTREGWIAIIGRIAKDQSDAESSQISNTYFVHVPQVLRY